MPKGKANTFFHLGDVLFIFFRKKRRKSCKKEGQNSQKG